MAIDYTKQSYTHIEDKIRTILNDEFRGVYVSSQYIEQRQVESIRISLRSINVIQQTRDSQILEFDVMLRHYLKEPHSIKMEEYVKNRIDRLKKLIWDNLATNKSSYYNLILDSIEFNIEDDESAGVEDLKITELNIKMNRLNITT